MKLQEACVGLRPFGVVESSGISQVLRAGIYTQTVLRALFRTNDVMTCASGLGGTVKKMLQPFSEQAQKKLNFIAIQTGSISDLGRRGKCGNAAPVQIPLVHHSTTPSSSCY